MWGVFGAIPQTVTAIASLDTSGYRTFCKRLRKWGKASRFLSNIGKAYPGGLVFGSPAQLLQLLRGIPLVWLYVDDSLTDHGPDP